MKFKSWIYIYILIFLCSCNRINMIDRDDWLTNEPTKDFKTNGPGGLPIDVPNVIPIDVPDGLPIDVPPTLQEPGEVPGGLLGGHFDFDTSSEVYEFGDGDTDRHIHEYDDKFGVTGVDFFKLLDDKLNPINDTNLISPKQRFIIIVGNAELSPGAFLEINGIQISVLDFVDKTNFPVFTLNTPSIEGDQQLTSFKINFSVNAIEENALLATSTECVQRNEPGSFGEYRNGALTIQALDAESNNISNETGTASFVDGGLLWEATIFWHKDNNCYTSELISQE